MAIFTFYALGVVSLMNLTEFIWAVLAGIIATIIGATTYMKKEKSKNSINQKGNGNKALINSNININSNDTSRKENDGDDKSKGDN